MMHNASAFRIYELIWSKLILILDLSLCTYLSIIFNFVPIYVWWMTCQEPLPALEHILSPRPVRRSIISSDIKRLSQILFQKKYRTVSESRATASVPKNILLVLIFCSVLSAVHTRALLRFQSSNPFRSGR